jgi:hypothetical protein
MNLLKPPKRIIKYFFGERPAHYWRSFWDRKEMKRALGKKITQKQMQFPSKIAILFLGTDKYIKFFPKYYESVKKLFLPNTPKDFFVFTDQLKYPYFSGKTDLFIIPRKHERWPLITLKSYETISKIETKLKEYPYIIFIDADMYVNDYVGEKEFFSHDKPLFSVQHPEFVKAPGAFEFRSESTAGVKEGDDLSTYWQSCFWGGKTKEVLELTKELTKRVNKDLKKNIIARWNDESHLNKYYSERKKDIYSYNPSYSYPMRKPILKPFRKKIVHMTGQDPNKIRN